MRPVLLAGLLVLMLLAAVFGARAQPATPPDPPICTANLREWATLAPSTDYQAMEQLLARTLPACRQLRTQVQARITALRPAAPANPCTSAETRWTGLRSSNDRAALQRFIADTPTQCAIREAAVQRLASLPAASVTRPPQTTTTTATTISPPAWRAGQEFDDYNGAVWCPRMVVIPAGSFMMGSPESETGRQTSEGPQRRVSIRQFAVGKFEVTRGQYAAFVNATGRPDPGIGGQTFCTWRNPGFDQTDDHPVACISWNDAIAYVAWLNRQTHGGYRLLSDAEWEYAARAGTNTPYRWGDTASHEYANYGTDQCCNGLAAGPDRWIFTAPAGSFQANRFGLYDMEGNILEWVQDCFVGNLNSVPADGSPYEVSSCESHVLRGGGWQFNPRDIRSAARLPNQPYYRVNNWLGFRVARTL